MSREYKEYIVKRGILGVSVRVRVANANGSNMYNLPSYDDNFNADDFDWGFDGRRQDQLSISILRDFMGTSIARICYHKFAKEVLGNMPVEGFVLSGYMIQRWIKTRQRVSIVV